MQLSCREPHVKLSIKMNTSISIYDFKEEEFMEIVASWML